MENLNAEQIKGCEYCTPKETEHGRIKYSYDDEDGMIACVHDTPPNRYGDKQLTWWLTVGFRGEQRDFVIEFCPFCGRRLKPYDEEEYLDACNG